MPTVRHLGEEMEKNQALNEIYDLVNEHIHLPMKDFEDKEAFYVVLNEIRDQKKACIEMIAFLHNESIEASEIAFFLDAYDIVKVGDRLVCDSAEPYSQRKRAMMALAAMVCEVYKNISKEKMLEIASGIFSGKTVKAIEGART
jgi:hypothetical protein